MINRETNKLAKELEATAELLTRCKENYPKGSRERQLLLLAKDATFFIYLEHVLSFTDFLQKMESGLSAEQLKKLEGLGINLED